MPQIVERVHTLLIVTGKAQSSFVGTRLVNLYSYLCDLTTSQITFDKFQPDSLTLVSLWSSFAATGDIMAAKSVHGFITRRCWSTEETLVGNALIDMYAKLCVIEYAQNVFYELPHKDEVSWNTIITGHAQNGLAADAVQLYDSMKVTGDSMPNQGTWVSILPAYAHLGALRDGMQIHCHALKKHLDLDVFLGTCLIDLYGKCGRLDEAMSLFYEVPRETHAPWNSIISCHGLHGHGGTSIKLFNDMLNDGVKPDQVTFLSLLSACSHSGLVDEGKSYFDLMQNEYGIKPHVKHFGCAVDLLGRAGQVETAYNFIMAMLQIHGNVGMGRKASNALFDLNPEDMGYYVLLSNLYANFGRWEAVDEVRSVARSRGLSKIPGWSSVEMKNRVESGHYSCVVQDVEDDEKESILTSHSERLAIMYGLLNCPPERRSIRVYNSLRMCADCHSVAKLISKYYAEREIVVRDSNRFFISSEMESVLVV
ncbi:hypothetical protein M569_09543 [Genlisea aurea]|uniref:DYW domain-containing protein n=1 Tax=Genlisea aurea TaxID=192259 RepID=S8CEF3_9LAMI|nr:hypothetical protein M569_09543 [Genlisea aurea]